MDNSSFLRRYWSLLFMMSTSRPYSPDRFWIIQSGATGEQRQDHHNMWNSWIFRYTDLLIFILILYSQMVIHTTTASLLGCLSDSWSLYFVYCFSTRSCGRAILWKRDRLVNYTHISLSICTISLIGCYDTTVHGQVVLGHDHVRNVYRLGKLLNYSQQDIFPSPSPSWYFADCLPRLDIQPPYYCNNQNQMYQKILHEEPKWPVYITPLAKSVISLVRTSFHKHIYSDPTLQQLHGYLFIYLFHSCWRRTQRRD